ncbi:MAG: hypothetical protein NTV97_13260 [Alphaproteobacteria bacterium]|nr:hypothetical protein [Alphaproteobacteria bacterium]
MHLESALDTVETLVGSIGGKLLLRVGRSQIAEMLNDGRLTRFQIGNPPQQLVEPTLDPVLARLEALEVLKDQIGGLVGHDGAV